MTTAEFAPAPALGVLTMVLAAEQLMHAVEVDRHETSLDSASGCRICSFSTTVLIRLVRKT